MQQVIARYVHSVEQLEILCLFVEEPERTWSEAEVFRRIQSSRESVSRHLGFFATDLFLAGDSSAGYHFSPRTPELTRQAAELVKTYREKRVAIVEAIYKAPLDPIRDFADAFKIRKDKP